MSPITDYMKDIQTAVDAALDEHLPKENDVPSRLHAAMRYAIFSGGKRLRPALCIASAEASGSTAQSALIPAIAIEALHTYTLIHDDLPAMDNDDLRRGKPTVHKQFDEFTAILAGDALLTVCFEWLGKTSNASFVSELAHATGSLGTIGGQQDDMYAKDHPISKEELFAIHERKTAALFAVSCKIGAIAGGAAHTNIQALEQFGYELGMAFQMMDDVADEDDITLALIPKEEALRMARAHENAAYAALEPVGDRAVRLREIGEFAISSFGV